MRRFDATTEGGEKAMNSERDDFRSNVFTAPSAHQGKPRTNVTESIIKMLDDFGLNEKEAQLYVHLLRYGPKRASDLAQSMKTYRLEAVSYTHLRAHETKANLVCRLLLEKK